MKKFISLKELLTLILGTAIVATGVHLFMLPYNLTIGSAAALAMVINTYIPVSVSAINLILNVFLLLIGFLLIGPEFGLKTIICSVLLPVFMGVYEHLLPNQQSLTQDPILDAVCYILTIGIGVAVLFSRNASTGGIEIVAKLMNKYLHMELGKAMSLSGMVVAMLALLVYDAKIAIISVLGTYFGGLLLDHFIFGLNIKRRVCILSKKLDEITGFILHQLHSGATVYDAIGAYDNVARKEIVTIVDKQEYAQLMDFIHKTDPNAFVTVISVNEVKYQPKRPH